MSQPTYDMQEVMSMSDEVLAENLEAWAATREYLAKQRLARGKDALDAKLLREAARRLRHIGENLGGKS